MEDNDNNIENPEEYSQLGEENINEFNDEELEHNDLNSEEGNMNGEDDIDNDIKELNIDLNEDEDMDNLNNNFDGQNQEDQLNNPEFDYENNLNEEEQIGEEEEMNDIEDLNNEEEMNLNEGEEMNYMMNDNNIQENDMNNENEIDNNIDDNFQANIDENNEQINDNNTNLDEMVLHQNEAGINNNDMNDMNMNEINNEENYNENNNNFETSDNQNDENNMIGNYDMNNFQEINDFNDIEKQNMNNEQMNNINNINNNNINEDIENSDPNMELNQGFDAEYGQDDEEGLMNQNINANNFIYNNANNNVEQNQMLLRVNDINQRFSELTRDFKSLEKQNQQLKMQLKYEQSKNKDIKPNDIKIYENSINQGKIFLEDIKKKNAELKNKIKELEEEKSSLNYKLIESNQRIKRLETDYNVNNKENEKNSENKNENDEIIKLKNRIDELEIINSKLTLDNADLKKKMENSEQEHNKQLKLITNYKNSELTSFQKVLFQYKQYFKNHNINPKLNQTNSKNNNLSQEIMIEMSKKDKTIKALNAKLEKYISEYKNIIDEKQISQQKCNQVILYNQKLLNEKNDLIKINQNLKMEIANLNQKIEMNKTKYKNHKYINENNMIKMQAKLAEYKQKVITLKLKINEMLGLKPKYQMKNQNSNINLINKQNLNNLEDIKKLTLTPTQKKIIPAINAGNIDLNKKSQKGSKIGNKYFTNNI